MKIAVSTEDGKTVSGHLGRARRFLVFQADDGAIADISVIENDFTAHAQGQHHQHHEAGHQPGHGHHSHADILGALSGCAAVITRGMGWRIAEDFRNAGIDAVITSESDANAAVMAYLAGDLKNQVDESACGCGH